MRPHDGRAVSNFITQSLQGEKITVYGSGDQTRSFCFVSDTVDGIYRLLMSDEVEPVNVGNPAEMTIGQLATLINEMCGGSSEIVSCPFPTDHDPKVRQPDITRARQLLGWEPRVALEDGLAQTVDYFREIMAREKT
jgi:dTDP-glucose 4,6-dehydratase